jgi:small subunit ribosomal protein S16
MAVRIRLRRIGAKKRPFYRVVVADSRSPRDGRFLDTLGWYDPLAHPVKIQIDAGKALQWLADGAEPTDSARSVLSKAGIWRRPTTGEPATATSETPTRELATSEAGASGPGTGAGETREAAPAIESAATPEAAVPAEGEISTEER